MANQKVLAQGKNAGKNVAEAEEALYDKQQALDILRAFNRVSGLGTTLVIPDVPHETVEIVHTEGACQGRCPCCQAIDDEDVNLWSPACQKVHCAASEFADRFGGRYFYQCDMDRIFIAAPIVADGGLAAAMIIGPVHIFEVETAHIKGKNLRPFPVRAPMYVQYLSDLLSACSVSVSDSSQSNLRLMRQVSMEQQRQIHGSIARNKQKAITEYPVVYEEQLAAAIMEADAATARAVLNEVLGMILSLDNSLRNYRFEDRMSELITVCSRAALKAGVSSSRVFDVTATCRGELARMKSNEQMCYCTQRFVEQMVFLVARLHDVECEDDIYRAIEYIRSHYNAKLTLEEVADAVGFSPSYFSRLFKKKCGMNFNVFLNQVRIEAAKNSLLSTDMTITEISRYSGYDDVSYFTRVFKRMVGMTPGYFRAHRGQVDRQREHG